VRATLTIDHAGVEDMARAWIWRLAGGGIALVVGAAVLVFGGSPASADGLCPQSLAGWRVVPPEDGQYPPPYYPQAADGRLDTGAQIITYSRPVGGDLELLIQFRDTRANGKRGLFGQVGTAANTSNLGATGTIGAAPGGAWCSSVTRGDFIWSSLSYQVGGVEYGAEVSAHVTLVPAR
jgi:hypothetical protein